MKKFLRTFALVLLLIPCVFAFAGCKEKPSNESIAETYNAQYVQRNIDSVAEKKGGVYIKLRVTASGSTSLSQVLAYGHYEDLYYFAVDSYEKIYDLTDENKVVIYDRYGEDEWTKNEYEYVAGGQDKAYYKQLLDNEFASIKVSLTAYYQYKDLPAVKTSAKVAGRDCAKYAMEIGDGSALFTQNFYIDKETGACLKVEISTTLGDDTTFTASFECLQFKTGYVINLPQIEEA